MESSNSTGPNLVVPILILSSIIIITITFKNSLLLFWEYHGMNIVLIIIGYMLSHYFIMFFQKYLTTFDN